MNDRRLSSLDRFLSGLDTTLRAVAGGQTPQTRPNPGDAFEAADLDDEQKRRLQCLMRVNHAGEVAAQALYQGQALTARDETVRQRMRQSAAEEIDHLAWCESRINELDSHLSLFNPLWYAGSFAIGVTAGLLGDRWSLGFVAETEKQVVRHLDSHLAQLAPQDDKSRAILEQMRDDEQHHATVAVESGGAALPAPVRKLMQLTAGIMTRTACKI